jgi:HEAT repeat protein
LIQALSESDRIVRSEAVSQIGHLGLWLDKSFLEDASTALIHILQNDPEISVRSSAALSLGIIGGSRAVPVLTEALSKDDQIVRSSSAHALGRLQDRSAISALTRSLQDEDYVREAAIRALRTLNAVEALPVLRKLVNCKAIKVRREVIFSLGFLGDSKDLPNLYKALQDKEFSIRVCAAHSLSQLNNRKGIPILEDALKTGNKDARDLALSGLQNFKGKVGLSSILTTAFMDDEYSIRKASIDFLEPFKESQEVVSQLKIALGIQNEDICRNAMDAAKTIGNAEALSHLRLLSETITVVERPLEAIAAIQSRCQFYNYEIAQSSPPELPETNGNIQNKLIQGIFNMTNNFNFDQRGASIGVNVANEGSNIKFIQHARQSINISEQDLAEAAQKIQALLNQLAQTYPPTTEPQKQTFIQKFLEQLESTPDLIKVLLAGGIEGLKILCPPAGVPVEMARRLYEVVQERHTQR